MYEVIFVRNGAKAYVKNPRVFLREKSAKRGFMKSSSQQVVACQICWTCLMFNTKVSRLCTY
jgi:hypothetical protein